nr:hypothetical protein [Pseudomonas aeruginosa]
MFNGGGGLLSSQKGIDVSLAGAFDNQAGSLDSRGFLTVKSAPEQSGRQTGERRRT